MSDNHRESDNHGQEVYEYARKGWVEGEGTTPRVPPTQPVEPTQAPPKRTQTGTTVQQGT